MPKKKSLKNDEPIKNEFEAKNEKDFKRTEPSENCNYNFGRERKQRNEPAGKKYRREIDEVTKDLDDKKHAYFSSSDLNSYSTRVQLASRHPMLEGQYFIDTNNTNNFYDAIYDHVFSRKSGLYITGEFRVGKTSCISNAILRLSVELPHIYASNFSAVRNHNKSKVSFCSDMLKFFRYYPSPHQNPIEAVPRFLITKAAIAGSRTCVIFVDEAQKLTVMQLGYLLEIWNEIRQEGFSLVTFLVGQTDLDNLYQLTEEEEHGAVISRFFVNKFRLGGIHSEEDLKNYLSAYDSKLFYPRESVWSYSRFFRMKAFDGGWRIADESKNFWNALMDRTHASERSLLYNGFRLAFINDSIHSFLIDSMRTEVLNSKESLKLWHQSVASAATSELLIGDDTN